MTLSNGHLDPLHGNPIQPVVEPSENTEAIKISSFEQGLINGLIGVDTNTYEAFITHSEQKKLESVRLKKIREQVAKNEEEREQVKQSLLNLHHTIQEREGQIQNSEARISKRERDRRRMEEQQGHWEAVKQRQLIDYSVASACFFVVIGGLFLFTDLYISKDVANNALGIDEEDAWIFASGLAGIAFVLKFAVDRIFEKPYRELGKKLPMTSFLIVISVGAILTLGFAGYVRNEGALVAMHSDDKGKDMQNELQSSLDGRGNEDMLEKEKNSANIERIKILKKPIVSWLFVLSGILFGISGAICFSIAMPNLTAYTRRGRANNRIRKLDKELESNYTNILKERTFITQYQAEKETAKLELDLLKPLPELQAEYKQLLEEELVTIEAMFKEQQEAEKSWHQEGHARGKKINLKGDLFVTPYQIYQHIFQWKSGKKAAGGSNTYRDTGRVKTNNSEGYLHQEIRKMIDYNFNKNQGY